MVDISSKNNGSLAGPDALASGLGSPALEKRADELRGMVDGSGRTEALRCTANGLFFGLALRSAWVKFYGPDVSLWPENLKTALATIEAGAGLTNSGDNLAAALQGLQLEEATMPAFDAATNVLDRFWISSLQPALSEDNWRTLKRANPNFSIIPDPAARAGLSFFSNPCNIVIPIGIGALFGRAATAGVMNAGRLAGMVPDAASSLGIIIGLGAESTGFVATSRVIANVIPPSPPLEKGGEGGFDNDITAEIASSTLFFGALRVFGAAGQFAQRLLPMTETGLAASKSFGHFSSVMGLAVTEEIQAGMGNAMAANSKEAFYTRLWRALFLHVTIHTVNGITGPRNMNNEIDRPSLNTGPFAERLKEMLTAPKMTATNGYEFRVPFSFAFEGNGKPPQNGQTTPAPSDPDIIEAKVGRPFQLPPDVPGELPSGLVARKADPDKFAEELDRKAAAEQNEGRMGQKRPKGAPPLQVRHPYQRRESSWRNWNRPHRKRSQERTCKAPRR